jgi:ADP-ribose pyrophosphatase YjhB (NUDIX family)
MRIPKNSKKVFDGEVFKIYQWKQKMFDSKYRIFERAIQQDGVSIIATYKDKVVVLKQKQPTTDWYYSLPGGYLDKPGESPKQGALRELLEETGLKPRTMKLWKSFRREGRLYSKFHIFIAQDCEKIADQDLDGGEIIEVQYKTFDQFLKLTDETKFHNKDLVIEMLRARLSAKKTSEFKKLIFGKN